MMKRILIVVILLAIPACFGQTQTAKVRTYYIAADEVEWDYAPGGVNKMMGMKFDGYSKVFVERGPHRIGSIYRKALYREYTDESFAHLKPRPAEWESSGILGPILRAEVGDTIRVVFKNNATHPYSMHPHGVFYKKDSEGALYEDGTSGSDKVDDAVPPGKTHVYTWEVPERAGPGPNDPSSIVWLYHSHAYEMRDVESGLVGQSSSRVAAPPMLPGNPKMSTGSSSAYSCCSMKTRAGIWTTTFRLTPAILRV